MKKIISFVGAIFVIALLVVVFKCSSSKDEPTPITFEDVVGKDYAYIDSVFKNEEEEFTHFYEVRVYMPERVDSAALHHSAIDSIVSIFAVGDKVWFFNHKIKGDSVVTDTCIYDGPFIEDCVMPWPLPTTFNQMMDSIASHKLNAPNKDIVLRRALVAHPKDYPDFTIYGGDGKWWFISTKNDSIRTDQCSNEWIKQYSK
jgi:hypothetical protein